MHQQTFLNNSGFGNISRMLAEALKIIPVFFNCIRCLSLFTLLHINLHVWIVITTRAGLATSHFPCGSTHFLSPQIRRTRFFCLSNCFLFPYFIFFRINLFNYCFAQHKVCYVENTQAFLKIILLAPFEFDIVNHFLLFHIFQSTFRLYFSNMKRRQLARLNT